MRLAAWRFVFPPWPLKVKLCEQLWRCLDLIHRERALTHLIYEAPILDRYRDKLNTIRRLYGMGFLVETWARVNGVVYAEEPVAVLKRELAGRAGASKDDMVYVARKCGLALPPTKADGLEDAADAFAAWLIGVRHFARAHLPTWDRKLYSPRGALL